MTELTAVLIAATGAALPDRGRTSSDRSIAYELEHRVLPVADVWVALRDDAIVGFEAVRGDELTHLHVQPEAQSRGVGRALLGRALERGGAGLRAVVPSEDARTAGFLSARGFVWEADLDRDGRSYVELRGPGPEPGWW